ncbi:MAG: hypothetical protein RIQ93_825 [Verrucomicrobiota bacterium]|jgi:sialate O-acetylesterase
MISTFTLFAALLFTGLSDSQVLQREANGAASPIVSGASDTAGRLFSRVDNGRWHELPPVSSGSWKTKLPPLAAGGPYTIQIRFDDGAGKTVGEKSFRDIYVGDLWVLAGQSNMVGRARVVPGHATDPRVRMMALNGVWQVATHPLHDESLPPGVTRPGTGPGLDFALAMIRQSGVPIGLLPCAKGGTSMAQWSPDLAGKDASSLYQRLIDRVQLTGGNITGVLWYQGENDTGPKPAAMYQAKFQEFVTRLRQDLKRPDLPFYYAQLARYINKPTEFYGDWNRVQEAQRVSESEIPKVRMVATVDLDMRDLIHISEDAQTRLGRRFANAAQGRGGPRFVDARWTSHNELRVRLTGVNGALQTNHGRIFGFDATTPDGRRLPLFFRVAVDAATGEIVLSANSVRETPEQIDLWYGHGHDPICNLTDSEDLALPAFGPVRLPPQPPAPVRVRKQP